MGVGIEEIVTSDVGEARGRRLRRKRPQEGGWKAGFLADEVEPADDGGLGATAFAGDLGGAEAVNAVQAKDFGDGGGRPAAAGIELLEQGEGGSSDGFRGCT